MSRIWTPRTSRAGLEYGGIAHQYYWNPSNNPGASYENCLANCTTMTYGRILEAGDPAPISGWHSASAWRYYLINGWTCEAYSPHTVRQGDILCWESGNHVAVMEYPDPQQGIIYCSHSYYTGDHGVAYWQGSYDTRSASVMGSTMQSVSNWMIANYPNRFYSYGSIYDAGLGTPEWVLRNPNSVPTVVGDFKFFTGHKTRRRRITKYV